MHKTVQFFQIIILLGLLLAFPAPDSLSAAYQLNVSGNRMSADFQNVPFSAVIADIGAKTGIRFIFLGGAAAAGYNPPLYLKYESLPIRTALEKLLSNFNYSLISDGNDNIRQVFILGAKSALKTLPTTQQPFVMAAAKVAGGRGAPAGNPADQDGMEIGQGEGMQIDPPSEKGMEITPGEGMVIGPGEGMQITPGAGMQVAPGAGMQIGSPGEGGLPEGMVIGSPGDQEMNPGSQNTEERVVNHTDNRTNPRTPVRRPSRWELRKK